MACEAQTHRRTYVERDMAQWNPRNPMSLTDSFCYAPNARRRITSACSKPLVTKQARAQTAVLRS